ncbi:unnamed protein product [Hymenolepis diminuta]|uniref:Rho-GAP domain-containing protein n=2 Tax=Hymenolepis diminuta TaxID=6216 RepID=A0A564Y5U2_HYMDI|nr:unnamed protein product [Hymenolepis diminuta]
MAFLMKMNRSGRMTEKLDLIPYFDYLLNHVDTLRAPLRSYRKFLENYLNSILKLSHFEKLEKGSENSPLNNLIAMQQLCGNIQSAFADEIGIFIPLLKDWENQCDLIMKAKYDLQRAQAQKDKDKQRSIEVYKVSESAYLTQREELYKMLCRFHSTELENQRKMKELQMKQASCLHACANQFEGNSPNAQTPSIPSRFFGAPLEGQLDADGYSIVMRSTIAHLTKTEAFVQEGIFRIPGQVSRINLLKDAFEHDMADEKLFEHCEIFEIADVMKQFLRDLPDPILPIDLLKNWPSEAPNVETVKPLIKQYIPEPSRRNLFLLLKFLSEVVDNQSTSKMTSENLAVTLWMSFRNKADANNVPSVVQYLINNAKPLLEGEREAVLLSPNPPVTPHVSKKSTRNPAPPPPRPKTTPSHNAHQSVIEASATPPPPPAAAAASRTSSSKMVTNFNNSDRHCKSDATSAGVTGKVSPPIPILTENPKSSIERETSVSIPLPSNENEKKVQINKDSVEQEAPVSEMEKKSGISIEKEFSPSFTDNEKKLKKEKEKEASEPEIGAKESESKSTSESEGEYTESPERKVKKAKHKKSKHSKTHKNEKLEFDQEKEGEKKSATSSSKDRHSSAEEEDKKDRRKDSDASLEKESKYSRSSSTTSVPPRPPSLSNKSSMC